MIKRSAYKSLTLFLWLIPGSLISLLIKSLLDGGYVLLNRWFGSAFPLYNPITEGELADAHEMRIATLALLFTLLLVTYLSQRLHNGAYEYVIDKTDGLYRVPEAARLYRGRYFIPDLIASLLAPLPLRYLVR